METNNIGFYPCKDAVPVLNRKGKIVGFVGKDPVTGVRDKVVTVNDEKVFNITELMFKRQRGVALTKMENKVLDDYILSVNTAKFKSEIKFNNSVKPKFPSKYIMDNDKYIEKKSFDKYGSSTTKDKLYSGELKEFKIPGYDYASKEPYKGGMTRATERLDALADMKSQMTDRLGKITEKLGKLTEKCPDMLREMMKIFKK